MVEIKVHRTRRIGGYSKSCATLRSAARARLGVAQFFDGLISHFLCSLRSTNMTPSTNCCCRGDMHDCNRDRLEIAPTPISLIVESEKVVSTATILPSSTDRELAQ